MTISQQSSRIMLEADHQKWDLWLFGIEVICTVIGNQSYVTDGKLCRVAITAKAERKSYDFNISNHG
jgi:hypothetical protein